MQIQQLISILDHEYNNYLKLHKINFEKWIETGEDKYKENELMNIGAAHSLLRIKQELQGN